MTESLIATEILLNAAITSEKTTTLSEIKAQIRESVAVKVSLLENVILLDQIYRLSQTCLIALRAGGKIISAGNGGSFADAQHLSAEFTSRFLFDRPPLASLALATNSSAISAIGNDYGYEQVFVRELQAIAKPEDVFIPISTSGSSANIFAAVRVAINLGLTTIAWTGESGGKLKQLCDCICIPSNETARIQECHILIGHIVCGLVEAAYFEKMN